ncbi:sorting nexin-25 isoform X2 [Pristis pectinata]|uniref:sorting nexin-25 isoform X2 n=1 Tax=Pristis pectinata TaxID=685728 RepID=UPI00223DA112|nr:sorting nexin-25 isoform X2 [Pristis pectinata]
MSLTQLLCRLLVAAFLFRWDPILLGLLFLWCAGSWLGDAASDERDHSAATDGRSPPETTISMQEVNQPKNQLDVTDGSVQSSLLHQSLKKVFDCSYSQFILLWYNPPEDTANQPLYQVLLDEFNTAVDYAVGKIRNLNYTRIELGLIQILTIHLRIAKEENKREKVFQTREDEVYFLRRSAEALIHNLFPDSLWKLNCYQYLMREVIALKVLEETINMVCDADFINQSLIMLLDQDSLAPEGENVIPNSPASAEKNIKFTPEYDVAVAKKERKLKEKGVYRKLKKFINKISKKSKKKRYIEAGSTMKHMDEVDGICNDDENIALQFKCAAIIPDDEFNSSHKVFEWLKENIYDSTEEQSPLTNCRITISEVSWDESEELLCTIDIENLEDTEECWSVKRTFHEFQDLQNELSKAFSSLVETELPSVNGLPSDKISDELGEDLKLQLTGFLEKLISNESILCNESVLNFFSPGDRDYWGLLTSLFSEEDEETDAESDASEGPCDKDLGHGEEAVEPHETSLSNVELQDTKSAELLPSTISSEDTDHEPSFRFMPYRPEDEDVQKARRRSKKVSGRLAELPEGIAGQFHKLLEEIICIEQNNLRITVVMGVVKYILAMRKKSLKKYLDWFFSKEQVTWYIDHLREVLWPNGKPVCPSPERSDEEKASAKEKAKEVLLRKIPVFFRMFLPGTEIVNNLFTIFQDTEANKRLVYTILVFLLFELIPEVKDSWKGDPGLCLEDLAVDL